MYIPATFTVEVFCGCNFRCVECPVGDGTLSRKRGYMPLEKYKIIANKVAPYAKYVFLHCWGEPMLNPDIFKIIEYSNFLGMRNNISTNGQLINEEKAKLLATSGTDINFSLDAFTQETFKKYRKRGDVERVKQALVNLVKYKNSNTTIRVQMCVFKYNEHEIPLVKKFANDYGIDFVEKVPYVRSGGTELSEKYKRPNFTKKMIINCGSLRNGMCIYLDGSVVLCCHDYDGLSTYGNIYNNDVIELYNSENANNIRKSMKSANCEICKNVCLMGIRK